MGRKSHYFRHTFSAHQDPKLIELADIAGAKALGVYWTLLEMYGASLRDDDEASLEQIINFRMLANAVNLRQNHLGTCMVAIEKCGLAVCRRDATRPLICYVSIPNFMKYYGSYTRNGEALRTNKRKEKKRKEKESKEKETEIDLGSNFKMAPPVKVMGDTEFSAKQKEALEFLDNKTKEETNGMS